jgi:hypothetical protein
MCHLHSPLDCVQSTSITFSTTWILTPGLDLRICASSFLHSSSLPPHSRLLHHYTITSSPSSSFYTTSCQSPLFSRRPLLVSASPLNPFVIILYFTGGTTKPFISTPFYMRFYRHYHPLLYATSSSIDNPSISTLYYTRLHRQSTNPSLAPPSTRDFILNRQTLH